MRQVDIIQRMRERVLPSVPETLHPKIEIEFKRIQDEVDLVNEVLNCTACPLAEGCTNKVPGVGSIPSDIMFVAEAPGNHEDEQGEPFVGPGGEMLMKAVQAVGWKREELFLTNLVKCHTPNNRQPLVAEITACYRHLQREMQVVKPKVVVCCGATAASALIHPDFKIGQEQGSWFERDGIRYIAVYNPSFLLRLGEGSDKQNQAKWEVFNALKKVKAYQESGFDPDHL